MAQVMQVLFWDRYKHVVQLNRLLGSQHYPYDNWISNDKTDIIKQQNTLHSFASTQKERSHTITKMIDNLKHGQYNSKVNDVRSYLILNKKLESVSRPLLLGQKKIITDTSNRFNINQLYWDYPGTRRHISAFVVVHSYIV